MRSPLPVPTLMPALQRAVQQVDPSQPIHQVRTMDEILVASLALQRVGSFMATFFAFAALLMATLGVYGVMSYSVRQRRVEFGTRMALGALGHDLLMLVLGGGARLTAYGLGLRCDRGRGVGVEPGPPTRAPPSHLAALRIVHRDGRRRGARRLVRTGVASVALHPDDGDSR